MRTLVAGERAPQFDLPAMSGTSFRLSASLGQKVWLAFYRYANCPLCHQHLFDITQRYEKLNLAKIQICALFDSRHVKFGKLKERKFPNFPMIADPSGSLYETYGVKTNFLGLLHPIAIARFIQAKLNGFSHGSIDGSLGRIPAHFLIDETGTIHTAFYGTHVADHIPWKTVEEFLSAPAKELPATKKRIGL